jgi:hypothetical protein
VAVAPAIALGEAQVWQMRGLHAEVAESRLGCNSQSAASSEGSATLVGLKPAAQRP